MLGSRCRMSTLQQLIEGFAYDLRYTTRMMRKSPGFASTAIVTLALAIGATTALFTVIHAVLLRPLHYPNPDRLVRLSSGATKAHFEEFRAHAFFLAGAAGELLGGGPHNSSKISNERFWGSECLWWRCAYRSPAWIFRQSQGNRNWSDRLR